MNHKDLSTKDARQGVETGTVRWVLRISLGLAVLAGISSISASSASKAPRGALTRTASPVT